MIGWGQIFALAGTVFAKQHLCLHLHCKAAMFVVQSSKCYQIPTVANRRNFYVGDISVRGQFRSRCSPSNSLWPSSYVVLSRSIECVLVKGAKTWSARFSKHELWVSRNPHVALPIFLHEESWPNASVKVFSPRGHWFLIRHAHQSSEGSKGSA